jgi:hypothetical protein
MMASPVIRVGGLTVARCAAGPLLALGVLHQYLPSLARSRRDPTITPAGARELLTLVRSCHTANA